MELNNNNHGSKSLEIENTITLGDFNHEDSFNLYFSGWLARSLANSKWRVLGEAALPCQYTINDKVVEQTVNGIGYVDHLLINEQNSRSQVKLLSVKKDSFGLKDLQDEVFVKRYPIGVCHKYGLRDLVTEMEYYIVAKSFDAELIKWLEESYNPLVKNMKGPQVTLPIIEKLTFSEIGAKVTKWADRYKIPISKVRLREEGVNFAEIQTRVKSGISPFEKVFRKFNFWQ